MFEGTPRSNPNDALLCRRRRSRSFVQNTSLAPADVRARGGSCRDRTRHGGAPTRRWGALGPPSSRTARPRGAGRRADEENGLDVFCRKPSSPFVCDGSMGYSCASLAHSHRPRLASIPSDHLPARCESGFPGLASRSRRGRLASVLSAASRRAARRFRGKHAHRSRAPEPQQRGLDVRHARRGPQTEAIKVRMLAPNDLLYRQRPRCGERETVRCAPPRRRRAKQRRPTRAQYSRRSRR